MSPRSRATLSIALTAVVGAMACVDTTGPGESCLTHTTFGQFFGRASGAASDSLAGCAYFAIDTPSLRVGMVLTNGGPRSTSHLLKLILPAQPETGPCGGTCTLTVAGGGFTGVIFLGERRFTFASGTMEVTSGSRHSRLMEGTLNATATDAAGSVTVVGTFEARCAPFTGEIAPERPRQEWSAHCDHPACFPFACAASVGDSTTVADTPRARRPIRARVPG